MGTLWGATMILGNFTHNRKSKKVVRTGDSPNLPTLFHCFFFVDLLGCFFTETSQPGKSQARHVIEAAGVDTWFLKLPGGEWEEAGRGGVSV